MPRVTVVGAGVVGLTCAAALAEAGFAVTVLDGGGAASSDVAGGLWMPYGTTGARMLDWARASYQRLRDDGHPIVSYLHLEKMDPAWLAALPAGAVRPASPGELPPGHDRGWVARVPLVEMPAHLRRLRAAVQVVPRRVARLDEVDGLVVHATGLAARELAGDADVHAVRGQVVWVRPPAGGVPCVCDEDALTYVLPRRDVCVVGGTAQPGDEDLAVRPDETRGILRRATRLVPALQDAEVLGARVGLRPARRDGPRVERVGDVIHCYGHGGAGLTLAWGCAAEVVRLAGGRP